MPNQAEYHLFEMETMPATQTLAIGKTAAPKYPELGMSGVDMKPDLNHNFIMLVGIPGCGKSCILQSNPDAFIFNLDMSPTVTNLQATMWPGIGRDGRLIDGTGGSTECTWDEVRRRVDILHDMAAKNKPRPTLICFDSLAGMFRVTRPWLAKKFKKEEWKDLGQTGWTEMYDVITAMPFELRASGYGVAYTCHLTKQYIQLSQEITEVVPELTVTGNFFKQLHPIFDLVAPVKVKLIETRTKSMKDLKNSKGEVVDRTEIEEVKFGPVHCIDFSDPFLAGITKNRNITGTIPFDRENGWAKLEEAYKTANPDAYP